MAYSFIPDTRREYPPLTVFGRSLSFRSITLMGIVNVTPDSFSDGGRFGDAAQAIETGLAMVEAGADILDIGGESTRPGAEPVDVDVELARVIPIIEGIRKHSDVFLSIDTYKAHVAGEAIRAGAEIVNDISGLRFDPAMAQTVASLQSALVIMHTPSGPKTMQKDIHYDDLLSDLETFFRNQLQVANAAGIDAQKIILDPGIGFGKTVHQNYQLLRHLPRLVRLGYPLLVGTSRKSMIGEILNKPPGDRLMGTAATVTAAIMTGAQIVRVHDVTEMNDVVRISEAIIDPS